MKNKDGVLALLSLYEKSERTEATKALMETAKWGRVFGIEFKKKACVNRYHFAQLLLYINYPELTRSLFLETEDISVLVSESSKLIEDAELLLANST